MSLFLRASSLEFRLIGLRGSHLGLRLSCLGANVVVVQLQQQLAFAYVVAFFHQQAFHRGGNGSMRFEILDGLNLPFVEIRLRMGPRCTVVARTFNGVWPQIGDRE